MSSLWTNKYVRVNQYTRPGIKLPTVKKIVLHWTANPGASALNHFKYFDGTAITSKRYASAHLFVDRNEAYCIIPLNEVAYHANDGSYRGVPELKPNANLASIGVEMCVEKDGSIHKETIDRTAKIVAELCKQYKLNENDLVRHYDITQKSCPTPWIKNPSQFTAFKQSVGKLLKPASTASDKVVVQAPKTTPIPSPSVNKDSKDGVRMYKPSNNEFINATSRVLNRLSNKDVHGDKAIGTEHREKLLKGELPLDDALALLFVAYDRGLFIGSK